MASGELRPCHLQVLTSLASDSQQEGLKFIFATDIYIASREMEDNQLEGAPNWDSKELKRRRHTARNQIISYEKKQDSNISSLHSIKLGRRSGVVVTSVAEFEYLMTFISLSIAHRACFLARWKPYIERELPAVSPIPSLAAIFPGSTTPSQSTSGSEGSSCDASLISRADLETYGFQNVQTVNEKYQEFTAVCETYEAFEHALERMERGQGVKFCICRYRKKSKNQQFERQYECYKAGDPDFVVKKEEEERKTTSRKVHCPSSISISISMAYAKLKNLHKGRDEPPMGSGETQPMETQPQAPLQAGTIDTRVSIHLKLEHKHPHPIGSIMDKADLPIDPR